MYLQTVFLSTPTTAVDSIPNSTNAARYCAVIFDIKLLMNAWRRLTRGRLTAAHRL
jgi:hypothetical protein